MGLVTRQTQSKFVNNHPALIITSNITHLKSIFFLLPSRLLYLIFLFAHVYFSHLLLANYLLPSDIFS
jgi:hypothetical protein